MEIARGLYLDELAVEPSTGFAELKAKLDAFLLQVSALANAFSCADKASACA
ncbi:hypothetical protein [Asaia astilbis]|uniref:hypothetical protein n=1 Tax=Asaia astilbis TaxID=610244 RepID=UPI000A4C7A5A|nr:hypothetical protein [Asaia astilbis]